MKNVGRGEGQQPLPEGWCAVDGLDINQAFVLLYIGISHRVTDYSCVTANIFCLEALDGNITFV